MLYLLYGTGTQHGLRIKCSYSYTLRFVDRTSYNYTWYNIQCHTPMFDTYMDAIDSELFSDKRKTALLIHALGAEGQRRYSKLKELTNYAEGAT